jgi:hypothetical protein
MGRATKYQADVAMTARGVMGHVSWGDTTGHGNKGHRFMRETYDWIAANSSFPNDR